MSVAIKKNTIHISLFFLTFITTTLAGSEWTYGKYLLGEGFSLEELIGGLNYSISFLLILTVHEFGHYFTAKYYDLKVTLPYYIPLYFGFIPLSIGTMGAIIRIKSIFNSRRQFFDVGIAGPIAGFLVALGVALYGFLHLPPPEYIFTIHPEYQQYGLDYASYVYDSGQENIKIGSNLLFEFLKYFVVEDKTLIPNNYEIMHYPYLFAAYLGCFFTALNLLPIGQLDGGHILYGLVGKKKHGLFSRAFFLVFLFTSGLGLFSGQDDYNHLVYIIPYLIFLFLCLQKIYPNPNQNLVISLAIFILQFIVKTYFREIEGFPEWLLLGLLLGRFVGIDHPVPPQDKPLNFNRKLLFIISFIIFILCFSPYPFFIA